MKKEWKSCFLDLRHDNLLSDRQLNANQIRSKTVYQTLSQKRNQKNIYLLILRIRPVSLLYLVRILWYYQ